MLHGNLVYNPTNRLQNQTIWFSAAMTETFKCPSCSAPLDFEGTPMQKCRFCGSNVIVPSSTIRQSSAFGGFGKIDFSNLSALTGKALKIAEIQSLIQQRRKIEAIKVFRETFGTGLAESKDAVERMERGESIDISGMQVRTTQPRATISVSPETAKVIGKTIGGSVLVSIIVFFIAIAFVVGIIAFVAFRARSVSYPQVTSTPVGAERPGARFNEKSSSIATEVFKVGGEGNGAGKFIDNRTIAVDAQGRIFSADFQGGRIQMLDANGNFVQQITADRSRTIDALIVDRKGALFVLQGYDLVRFDIEKNAETGRTRIDGAVDATISPGGRIFVATRRKGVTVLNPDGTVANVLTFPKELGIDLPNQIAVDGSENLYIHEDRIGAVFKIGPKGNFLSKFGGRALPAKSGGNQLRFSGVSDLAVDSVGRVYVVETSSIKIVDGDGNPLDEFGTTQAFGIALNDSDEVFVASRPYVVKYTLRLNE